LIFVWRPIEESIHSLAKRNNFTLGKVSTILNAYHINLNQIKSELEKENKDIIDVDYNDLLEQREEFVKKIYIRINRKCNQNLDTIKSFLDAKLKHI
jgi:hypothetical protein